MLLTQRLTQRQIDRINDRLAEADVARRGPVRGFEVYPSAASLGRVGSQRAGGGTPDQVPIPDHEEDEEDDIDIDLDDDDNTDFGAGILDDYPLAPTTVSGHGSAVAHA